MDVKEYTLITEHDIRGIGAATIIGKANGGDESYTVELNEAQAKKVLAQGAQLFDGDTQVTLADFAEEVVAQAIDDGKCVDDYTNGDKNHTNSRCKVFGETRFFQPKTVKVPAADAEEEVPVEGATAKQAAKEPTNPEPAVTDDATESK